jgi:regulator of RNase E activity RraA
MGLQNGFVGALIDGAVRDTHDLHRMNFPAFSRTIAPGFICGKVAAVSFDEPVCIGGVPIAAGAILFGDNDGVVVMDPAHLDAVIGKAQAIRQWEHKVHRAVAEGCSSEEIQKKAGPMP